MTLALIAALGMFECTTLIEDEHVVSGLMCPKGEVALGVNKLSLSKPEIMCAKIHVVCGGIPNCDRMDCDEYEVTSL